jgi:type IV secretory pathway TraG/TraD family ATPase VirD4
MSIKKSSAKKKVAVYAGATLLTVGGIHQLIATGLAASILTQILAIDFYSVLGVIILFVLGATFIGFPIFLVLQHIYCLWTLEPCPKTYSAQTIKKFLEDKKEWQDGLIAWVAVNFLCLIIAYFIGSKSQISALGFGFFVFTLLTSTASGVVVVYPKMQPSQMRSRGEGNYGNGGFAYINEAEDIKLIAETSEDYARSICFGHYVNPYINMEWVVNKWSSCAFDNPIESVYYGETNAMTFSPTGGGKGATAIIPTLLVNDESAFVMDIKGENFFVTFLQRLLSRHRIIKINPFNLFGQEIADSDHFTDRFNPLHNLKPDSPKFVSNIMKLSSAMVVSDGKDEHFSSRGRDLVTLLIGHICSDPAELAAGNNNLPRVAEILGMHPKQFSEFMENVALNPLPFIRNTALTFASPDSREIEGVRATVSTQLSFLNVPHIAYFLSGHTFDFSDLRKEPTTIYFMLELEELKTQYRFARLIVQSLFNALMTSPKYEDRRVLVLLDEQAQLGNMEVLQDAPAIMRGYKVRIWSIFQDIPQVIRIYKDAWETLISNSGIVEFMKPNDSETCKHLTGRIGDYTITEPKQSRTDGTSTDHEGKKRPSVSWTYSEQSFGRSFLSPQDLYGMPRDRAIIISPEIAYPILIKPRKYFEGYSTEYQLHEKRVFDQHFLYAPHPVHDRCAFAWMRNFYSEMELMASMTETESGENV